MFNQKKKREKELLSSVSHRELANAELVILNGKIIKSRYALNGLIIVNGFENVKWVF